ncbi:hypothetical protein TNCV_1156751 [Trichonephila clavipes]|nr:hypothetical protein TNCV_1156751 [Trichonephila clavipes]
MADRPKPLHELVSQSPKSRRDQTLVEVILRRVLLGKAWSIQSSKRHQKGKPKRFNILRRSNTDFPRDSQTFFQPIWKLGLFALPPRPSSESCESMVLIVRVTCERSNLNYTGQIGGSGNDLSKDQARRRFVEWAQNESAGVLDFHMRILFSDEAHFWLNGYVNKQNCRIWSEANPQVYVETPLHPEKLTVWCALWAGGMLLQKR